MDAPSSNAATAVVPNDVNTRITPMMEQYIEIKAANPDCLLFYRMGDFYELFFDDAEVASRALGIMLTKRGKHLGRDIPMCGVPIERADEYLHRLIALGHRVAVCEQLEDPAEARKRGAKSVVRRDVIRLVTPGTLTEDTLLDARRNNYLLAVARARTSSTDEQGRLALAWIDISTGEFGVAECEKPMLAAEVARIEPGEIIVSDALYNDADFAGYFRSLTAVTPLATYSGNVQSFGGRPDANRWTCMSTSPGIRKRPRPATRCAFPGIRASRGATMAAMCPASISTVRGPIARPCSTSMTVTSVIAMACRSGSGPACATAAQASTARTHDDASRRQASGRGGGTARDGIRDAPSTMEINFVVIW